MGDLGGAVERLHAGQRPARNGSPVDFIDASVIDSRLRRVVEGQISSSTPSSAHRAGPEFEGETGFGVLDGKSLGSAER